MSVTPQLTCGISRVVFKTTGFEVINSAILLDMNVVFHNQNGMKVAEVKSDSSLIDSTADALDLIANPDLEDARKIILYKENIAPDIFALRTGMAGEIMQKLVNYQIKWAIIGDFDDVTSKSLHAFIIECNRGSTIGFMPDVESAKEFLLK